MMVFDKKKAKRRETPAEHIANAITHGIGFGISIVCLVLLVVFASLRKGVWEVVSCSVFGATLVILYLASTLYHSIQIPRIRHVLHVIDRSAIYLLIAGTYTPYLLIPLRGGLLLRRLNIVTSGILDARVSEVTHHPVCG